MSRVNTSITAYTVTCSLTKLARIPRWRGYFSEDMIRLNEAFTRHSRTTALQYLLSWLPPGLAIRLMDWLFIPGMMQHYLFRKRLIEGEAAAALARGVTQVIVLGGGFDTLALCMAPRHPAAMFFEFDLPATQRQKTRVLDRMHYPIPANCVFAPADLSAPAPAAALRRADRFDPQAPTLVILEGVLMYLEEHQVTALFTALHELCAGTLTILFGATATADATAGRRVRMVDALLCRRGEGTRWHLPGAEMPRFMAELGYELTAWLPYHALQARHRAQEELAGVPAEDENFYVVAKMPHSATKDRSTPLPPIPFISVKP